MSYHTLVIKKCPSLPGSEDPECWSTVLVECGLGDIEFVCHLLRNKGYILDVCTHQRPLSAREAIAAIDPKLWERIEEAAFKL